MKLTDEEIAREAAKQIGERIPYWTPQKEKRVSEIILAALNKRDLTFRSQRKKSKKAKK